MTPTLIVLRGNSGSGKSTVAKMLQQSLGPNTLLIDQDKVRIEMLHTRDHPNNLAINLIKEIALYGYQHCDIVILEGILSTARYKDMLLELINQFSPNCYIYYFDIPFEETVKRHEMRAKRYDFSAEDMKRWWIEQDVLHLPNEQYIFSNSTQYETVQMILKQVQQEKKEIRK
jgi:predicted kinase